MDSKKVDQRFFIGLFLLSLTGAAIIMAIQQFTQWFIHPDIWYIQLYHIAITLITFMLVKKGTEKKAVEVPNYIMAATGLRLLLSGAVLFGYYYFVGAYKVNFTVFFFAFYLSYTTFEIITLLSKLRQISDNSASQK